jgi:hypothetical protein
MMVELPGSGVRLSHCKPDIVAVVGTGRGDGTRQPAPRAGITSPCISSRCEREPHEPAAEPGSCRTSVESVCTAKS